MSVEADNAAVVRQRNPSSLAVARDAFIPLLLPLVAIAAIYAPTALSLVRSWNDYDNLGNTHGWLILLVVAWLLYEVAKAERRVVLRPSIAATTALTLASIIWLVLVKISIQSGHQLVLPVVMWLSIAALYGYVLARRCVFALAYFYFAIPIWGAISFLFQWGTVFAVRLLLRVSGIPVYFQGNELHLPAGVLVVEGGCSGIHFFVVAMAIAVLCWRVYGVKRPWVLLAFAAGLAVLTNWLRVFIIAVAGYVTNMQHYLIRVDHYRFGWILFAMAMVVFFYVAGRMKVQGDDLRDGPSDNAPVSTFKWHWSALGILAFAILALIIGPLTYWASSRFIQAEPISAKLGFAPQGWLLASADAINWQPVFANADDRVLTRYRRDATNEATNDATNDATSVDMFHAVYAEQRQEKKLAGYDNSIIGVGYRSIQDDLSVPAPLGFARSLVEDAAGVKWAVLHTYYAGDRRFTTPLTAQVAYGLRSILSWQPMGVFAIRAVCTNTCAAASSMLNEFARALPAAAYLPPKQR